MRKLSLESLERRELLATLCNDDLAHLCDEFEDSATLSSWLRVNETEGWNADQLEQLDVDGTQPGRLHMAPYTTSWYEDYRGPMVYREATGDFIFATELFIGDRDDVGGSDENDVPGDSAYSLAGLMIRTPREITNPGEDWLPGSRSNQGNSGENYVFLSLGYADGGNDFNMEVKTTRNSNSNLEVTSVPNAQHAELRIARIGNSVFVLHRLPSADWVVHRRYDRPDMPETMQLGMVSYTDWPKVNDYTPFYQNSNVLTEDGFDPTPDEPFNPDIQAGYEYIRVGRPEVPEELQGQDLFVEATDEQLLEFLTEPNETGEAFQVVSVNPNGGLANPADLNKGAQPTSWHSQKSLLHELTIEFNQPTNASLADFQLTNLGLDAANEPSQIISLDTAGLIVNGATVSLQLPQIPDGVYELRIRDSLLGGSGEALDGNGDGLAGGDYVIAGNFGNGLYQLQADWNGDGGVSVFDFSTFSYWFGEDTTTAPGYVDLNGDGGVSVFDFTGFSQQFGQAIVPADTLSARIGVANDFRRGDAPAPIRTVVDNSVINNNGDGNTVTGSTVAGSTGRTRSTGNKVNDVALEEVLREWTLVG